MAEYALRFSGLDKDQLKADFINYLQTTSEFQNFNPNASGWATLLDMLAYNAYNQSMMANFNFNELFLNTAQKRQNVVARAYELGYSPVTATAAQATLQLTVTNVTGNPSSLTLPAASTFTTVVDNQTYNFVTLVPYTAVLQYDAYSNPYYSFVITVYEGLYTQNSFVLDSTNTVVIPNQFLDSSTLRVYVTINGTEMEFNPPGNFLTVTGTNYVYYLTEGYNNYNVMFGDNTFGYMPVLGSLVRVTYNVTSGSGANNANVFSFSSTIPGASTANVAISTTTAAYGGADQESISSIKVNALDLFKTQDRAVTALDYAALIRTYSQNVSNVITWGGETENPPLYGKTVACVLPKFGDTLTPTDKANIQTLVTAKAVGRGQLVFRDPIYMNVVVNTTVTYNNTLLTIGTYNLQQLVQNTIASYITTNLSQFGGELKFSNMGTAIDKTDPSISDNTTSILLKYKYTPTLYQTNSINFSFNNAIDSVNKSYSIISSLFYIQNIPGGVWIEDDGNGNLNAFYTLNGVKTYALYNIGTVNYATGVVAINSILITGLTGVTIDFTAIPATQNIYSSGITIIQVDSADITVNVVPLKAN